jgi:tRNA (cmo5U34)-methyltransferase
MNEQDGQFHFHPETYLELVRAEIPSYDQFQDEVAAATEGLEVTAVLDLGTGTGETLRRVVERHPSASFVGVDESGLMLEQAAAVVPAADLHVQRLEDELPAGSFDLVVSALAVHHLDGPAKADLFRRVAAVLRPGGRLVLGDVVVPEDPQLATVPLEEGVDLPSRIDDHLDWLAAAGLVPGVRWAEGDLAVIVADRR